MRGGDDSFSSFEEQSTDGCGFESSLENASYGLKLIVG